jgi:hypothetical protein
MMKKFGQEFPKHVEADFGTRSGGDTAESAADPVR